MVTVWPVFEKWNMTGGTKTVVVVLGRVTRIKYHRNTGYVTTAMLELWLSAHLPMELRLNVAVAVSLCPPHSTDTTSQLINQSPPIYIRLSESTELPLLLLLTVTSLDTVTPLEITATLHKCVILDCLHNKCFQITTPKPSTCTAEQAAAGSQV